MRDMIVATAGYFGVDLVSYALSWLWGVVADLLSHALWWLWGLVEVVI